MNSNRTMKHKSKIQRHGDRSAGPGPGTSRLKSSLTDIASSTLEKIEQGSYNMDDKTYDLSKTVQEMKDKTLFFADNSSLSKWRQSSIAALNPEDSEVTKRSVRITISECSTLAGSRALNEELNLSHGSKERIGVLNFASAKNPGGGFLTGAQAQEESIARSSTIYPSLMTGIAQRFYQSHRKNPNQGYYSHAMIYSPRVLFIRSDDGAWREPFEVDIVTSCAVNAGVVRRYLRQSQRNDESDLDAAMKERMARILCLFEQQGVRNLVLGSFGTGVFKNRVELVAEVWKELLISENARFRHSFDCVVFAILGNATYTTFKRIFSDPSTTEGHRRDS